MIELLHKENKFKLLENNMINQYIRILKLNKEKINNFSDYP